jgi:hypothetical protein
MQRLVDRLAGRPQTERADRSPRIESSPDSSAGSRAIPASPYVWRFESPRAGPRVTIQALTHGNEVCGAICNDWLLREQVRPTRGTLTLTFANVEAFRAFDAADPFASRCVDEDFNRLWTTEVLDGPRTSRDLARARELRPVYDDTDFLLDLHSMTDPCPPLALAGPPAQGPRARAGVGVPQHIVIDAGHAAGKRLRDYGAFDDPVGSAQRAADRMRPALGARLAGRREAGGAALPASLRHGRSAFFDAHVDADPPPSQRAIQVTDVVTIESDAFAFAHRLPDST